MQTPQSPGRDGNVITLNADLYDLFQVFTVFGLAAELEQAMNEPAEVWWDTEGNAHITCAEATIGDGAKVVKEHAELSVKSDWMTARTVFADGKGKEQVRATLSPRVGRFAESDGSYHKLQTDRWRAIDSISFSNALDWRFIGALGEPANWWVDKIATNPDYGASAWEMKTRNRGEELLQNRLSLLGEKVALRDWIAVEAGLTGESVIDEAGKNAFDSRTPTGLRRPGPTDNAAAWCALAGLSVTGVRPIAPSSLRARPRSVTYGSTYTKDSGNRTTIWLYAPIPTEPTTLSRVRAVFRSAQLERFVREAVEKNASEVRDGSRIPGKGSVPSASAAWLRDHGIGGVVIARKYFTDNPNAPEPWAVPEHFEGTSEIE